MVGSALAVGLIWLFPFEMIINGLAFALPWLKYFQWILITPNAGSLATALGANAPQGAGPVIVSSVTSGPAATLVLLAYVLVFTALTVIIIRRRDIA